MGEEKDKVVHSELGSLIDTDATDFREFCKDKDLGYLSSFHNLLVQTYNQVKDIKDQLVAKIKVERLSEDSEEKKILNGVYVKLLLTEEKVFIVRDIIKSRKLED